MIKINLLPPEQRVRRKAIALPKVGNLVFVAVVAGIVALMVIVFLVQEARTIGLKGKIVAARLQTNELRPQIEQIEKLTAERRELDTHMQVITQLEKNRSFEVMLLDELNKRAPEHLWFTSYSRSDSSTVVIEGVTFSNLIVADFMTRLERSVLFNNVDLTIAERGKIEEMDVVKFSLTSSVQAE